ncbi:MAG: Ig-like domain-containing protein [Dehalococcoidia bacterium]
MNSLLSNLKHWAMSTRRRRWVSLGALGVAVAGVVALASAVLLASDGDGGPAAPLTGFAGFSVSPSGKEVPRLTPVRVHFEKPPAERDAAKLLRLEPQPEGEYVWADEQTVYFQPAYPGFLRGKEYAITVPARPEAGLAKESRVTFVAEGPLTVEAVIPAPGDKDVPAGAQILIQFSRSVAPLTVIKAQATGPVVVFDPPLAGKGEWLNTSLYRFVPETLEPDRDYRATVAAGLSSAADGALDKDYVWTFRTYGPAVAELTPEGSSIFASLKQEVVVFFNQPMDRASVAAGLKVVEGTTPVPGDLAWDAASTKVTWRPTGTLKHETSYAVTVEAGLKSAKGSPTKVARTATFKTVGVPRVSVARPSQGATSADRYGVNLEFSNPMDETTFEGRVSLTGFTREQVDQSLYAFDRNMGVGLSLRPSTSYTFTIAPGVKDRYGQELGAYTLSFTTGKLQPSLSFAIPNQITTYSSATEPILYFHSTNRTSASFSLYRLTPDEARSLQLQNYIPHSPPGSGGPDFKPSQPVMRQWTATMQGKDNEVEVTSTSLSGGGPLPKGDYYVITGTPGFGADMAFSVVDTALILKESDKGLLVWAIDLASGRPVTGAAVTADGPGVVSPRERATGPEGLVTFPYAERANPFDEKGSSSGPGVVTLRAGGRYGVATMAWQRGFDTYQLGVPGEYRWWRGFNAPVGHVYADRPIYRPGETVSFKATVRLDDDAAYAIPPADYPVRLIVQSSDGRQLFSEAVQLNSFGTYAAELALPADAKPGGYAIWLSWKPEGFPPQEIQFAQNSFTVAEFRVPEFEVQLAAPAKSYASGDTIDVSLSAGFFFGGAVPGAKVEWAAVSTSEQPRFEGFEKYTFGDPDSYFRRYYQPVRRSTAASDPVRARGTLVTDEAGKAAFPVRAEVRGDEGPQQYTISATVTDTTGQAVAASTNVTVHPASVYAGVRAEDYFSTVGGSARVSLVSVDLAGKRVASQAVALKVYERKWVTTKEQTPEGGRRYRSEPVDTLLETLNATTDARGEATVTVRPSKAGSLRLVAEARDSRGRTSTSATYLWVSSGEFVSWYFSNDDSLQLVADKDKYEVDDVAKILVPAPFGQATGLVTVERGAVHSARVQDFPTNSTVVEVLLEAKSVPNVFVSTVIYRPPTDADPIPRFKVGYAYLPVSTKTRLLNVEVKADTEQAQPGQKVTYQVKVTDSAGRPVKAELSVAVVDKAVLSLAEDTGPDGLKAFWFERGLGVRTASSLAVSVDRANDTIAEPRQGGKGGSGLDDEAIRKDFRNTAFWAPQVTTDDSGRASVTVTMPDNLTTWRTQVRAISGDTLVGDGVLDLLSTKPLLLRPALPRFLRVGDTFDLRVLVRNATAKATDANISASADGLTLQGGAQTVRIEPGESKLVLWPAKVTQEGRLKLAFKASAGDLSDAVAQELPMWLDVTPETTATGGVVKDTVRVEPVFLPDFALQAQGRLEVSVQATLTGLLRADLKWFEHPALGREKEDTVSIAARVIATAGVVKADRSAGRKPDLTELRRDLATLVLRQNTDGGWRWCAIYCPESDPWVTQWALLAVAEVKAIGESVDDLIPFRARGYVHQYGDQARDVIAPRNPNDRAFLLYALAAAGAKDEARPLLKALFEQQRASLNDQGRAWLLLGLQAVGEEKGNSQVNALLNDLTINVIPSANGNHWEGIPRARDDWRYYWNSDAVTSTSAVLQALTRLDPSHPLIEETVRWLMVARGTPGWGGGPDAAQGVSALSEFAAKTGELTGDFDFEVGLGSRTVLEGRARGDDPAAKVVNVPLSEVALGKVTPLTILRDFNAKGRLYYAVNLRYQVPAKSEEALNRGFAISHEYSKLEDATTVVDSATLGEVIRVTVTVVTGAEREFVRVDDFLPAGLEPIDASLKISDPALTLQLQADRRKAEGPDEDPGYYAPWFWWYWSPWNEASIRDDRVVLEAQRLPKGVHTYVYYARATTTGDFFVPPAVAEESKFPEVFGRSDSGRFTVRP